MSDVEIKLEIKRMEPGSERAEMFQKLARQIENILVENKTPADECCTVLAALIANALVCRSIALADENGNAPHPRTALLPVYVKLIEENVTLMMERVMKDGSPDDADTKH